MTDFSEIPTCIGPQTSLITTINFVHSYYMYIRTVRNTNSETEYLLFCYLKTGTGWYKNKLCRSYITRTKSEVGRIPNSVPPFRQPITVKGSNAEAFQFGLLAHVRLRFDNFSCPQLIYFHFINRVLPSTNYFLLFYLGHDI